MDFEKKLAEALANAEDREMVIDAPTGMSSVRTYRAATIDLDSPHRVVDPRQAVALILAVNDATFAGYPPHCIQVVGVRTPRRNAVSIEAFASNRAWTDVFTASGEWRAVRNSQGHLLYQPIDLWTAVANVFTSP